MTEKKIEVRAETKEVRGVYSNVMQVQQTKEEFVLDFYTIFPPAGALNARVIISPGHLKRMLSVLENILKQHENAFGEVAQAESPEEDTAIGFRG